MLLAFMSTPFTAHKSGKKRQNQTTRFCIAGDVYNGKAPAQVAYLHAFDRGRGFTSRHGAAIKADTII